MFSEKIHVKVAKNARIIHLKSESKQNTKLVIALHGYAQLSTYFARRFEEIHPDFDVLIPEALNRFYVNGSSGRVGASWMTREERESDILDNQNYLFQIVKLYQENYREIILLGFSQGGATAARFCHQQTSNLHGLIVWASVFPPDISPQEINQFQGKKFFILGTEDQFFPNENQKEVLALQKKLGYQTVQFLGGHDIDISVLNSVLNQF